MSGFDDFEDFDAFDDADDESFDDFLDADDDEIGLDEDGLDLDAEPVRLSPAEQQRRIDAFEKQTDQYMKIAVKPKTYGKAERVEAIRWLGESGNFRAIPALLKVYQKDRTAGMKEEAAYALGQFKAFDQAQNHPDPDISNQAYENVDQIILQGQFGKRANLTPIYIAEAALAALALVLLILGFILSATVGQSRRDAKATSVSQTQTAMPTATPDTANLVEDQLQTYYVDLYSDSVYFQQELLKAGREEPIACDLDTLANPPAYTLSQTWQADEAYQAAVSDLNAAREALNVVRSRFEDACSNNQAIPRQEALDLGGNILTIQRETFNSIRNEFNEIGIEVTEQVFATSTPLVTAIPDATLTPTPIDISNLTTPIFELERLIERMTDNTGATSQIAFFWQQVVDQNQVYLSGCNQPEPQVPENYSLDPQYIGVSEDLDNAVRNVNNGLQATRQAITAFYATCNTEELPEDIRANRDLTVSASQSFNQAQTLLTELQGN